MAESGKRGGTVMAVRDDAQDDARSDRVAHLGAFDDPDPGPLRRTDVENLRALGCVGRQQACLDRMAEG